MMQRLFLILGGISGLTAVILGAFGAHTLRATLDETMLHAFETGVRYQVMHTFALIVLGLLPERYRSRWMMSAGICFVGGLILFSGSLYMLSVFRWGFMGPVTPVGGLLFMAGWSCFILGILFSKQDKV